MDKQKVQQEINKNDVLAAVQNILEQQTLKGLLKYGTTVQPDMHSVMEWIDHASEETADKLVYLQALKKRIHLMIEEVIKEKFNSKWAITERLSIRDLKHILHKLNERYAGNLVQHVKSEGVYLIKGFVILNMDGGAEIGVEYTNYSINNQDVVSRYVTHVRPAREFFDGRFQGAILDGSDSSEPLLE